MRSSLRAKRSNPGVAGRLTIPGSPRRFAPRDDGCIQRRAIHLCIAATRDVCRKKISSGCVTDRRVEIVPIEGYRLSFIESVDDLAGADPIFVCFAEVIA